MTRLISRKKLNRATLVSFLANIVLSIGKLIVGILAFSQALISESMQSFGDVVSTIISYFGVKHSYKEEDDDHQFGHERFDAITAIIIAIFYLITATVMIVVAAFKINDNDASSPIPTVFAIYTALLVIIIKAFLFFYTSHQAKVLQSTSLKATAKDHITDVFSAGLVVIGLLLAYIWTLPLIDIITSLLICLFIIYNAIVIFIEAINELVDKAAPKKVEEMIKNQILKYPEIKRLDSLKTRLFGHKIFVDIEIGMEDNMSLFESHQIAEKVKGKILAKNSAIKDVMIHINPTSRS